MWAFVATALVLGSCAQQDWIDRTLVTVDVTGVWQGTWTKVSGGPSGLSLGGTIEFTLQQQGSKVTGRVSQGSGARVIVPIEGNLNGDMFSFHEAGREKMDGTCQVLGEEMTCWADHQLNSSFVVSSKISLYRQQ